MANIAKIAKIAEIEGLPRLSRHTRVRPMSVVEVPSSIEVPGDGARATADQACPVDRVKINVGGLGNAGNELAGIDIPGPRRDGVEVLKRVRNARLGGDFGLGQEGLVVVGRRNGLDLTRSVV